MVEENVFRRMNLEASARWAVIAAEMQRRLDDDMLVKQASTDLLDEQRRGVPVAYQTSFETWLEKAEIRREEFASSPWVIRRVTERLGSAGAQSRGRDSLNDHILEWAIKHPALSWKALLRHLQDARSCTFFIEVSQDTISYENAGGKAKTAKVDALSDRLSRIRRKLKGGFPH